jgi:hypothetical protein
MTPAVSAAKGLHLDARAPAAALEDIEAPRATCRDAAPGGILPRASRRVAARGSSSTNKDEFTQMILVGLSLCPLILMEKINEIVTQRPDNGEKVSMSTHLLGHKDERSGSLSATQSKPTRERGLAVGLII